MPGLRPNESEKWDNDNIGAQVPTVLDNTAHLVKYFYDYFPKANKLSKAILTRYTELDFGEKNITKRLQSTKGIFELQRDLGALILLCENGFDFGIYQGNTTDLYQVAQEFIRQTGTCTDIAIQFPKMVQDAILAIQSDGYQPPAKEMQRVQDYFNEKYIKSMDGTLI